MPRWNRALAAERKARAVELACAGKTYEAIARELGYANRGTAYKVVHRALADRTIEAVDFYRALEVARLDELQRGFWAAMEAGDTRAGMVVLRVIEARCRVLGLLADAHSSEPAPTSVVTGPASGSRGGPLPGPAASC